VRVAEIVLWLTVLIIVSSTVKPLPIAANFTQIVDFRFRLLMIATFVVTAGGFVRFWG
jgi:hypothetical protein